MKAAETPSYSKHGEISKTDCTAVTWKLGKSVESIEEEELEKSEAGPSESNNNDEGQLGDSRHLQRTSSNCVRFKDPHHQQSESDQIMTNPDGNKSSFFERTLSWGSKPKIMSRQRMNTFSHCQYYTINETPNTSQTLPGAAPTDEDDQDISIAKRPNLRLNIDTKAHVFPEIDNFDVSSFGSHTAPVSNDTPDARRTFSFGGGAGVAAPPSHRKVTRLHTLSGDSGLSAAAQRRTFSFGGAMMSQTKSRGARAGLPRQKTISGDSAYSARGSYRSLRLLGRALSTNLTIASDGSSSTILLEDWRPIFDKFDREVDGKQDGKIPLEKFIEILEEDPVWKESVPKPLKDKIIDEVDLNKDGVIDYHEFITLVKGKHLGLGSKRRKAFRQLLKETVDFLVPYKYTYQNQYSCLPPPLFMLSVSLLQIIVFVFNSFQVIGDISLYGPVPYCSHLIYNPSRRVEAWRYVSYSLVHSGLFHVTFNILIQLVLGIPLEMVHRAWRVAAVYLSGVLAGSLWTSVVKPSVFLSGASGGVYALITAHLGTVIMNHREMSQPWVRVGVVTITAATDVGVYVYQTAILGQPAKPVSYPAHMAGAVSGLLVGVLCLRNLSWEPHQRLIWLASAILYLCLILVALVWSLLVSVDTSLIGSLGLDTACDNFVL